MRAHRIGAAFVTALLLFGGCATHALHTFDRPRAGTSTVVVVQTVESFEDETWLGLSVPFTQQPQLVQIKSKMPFNKTCRVVAHELLHAAGYAAHIPQVGDDCYFNPTADNSPLGPPCAAEVAKIKKVTRTFTVVTMDEELFVPLLWAVAMWNRAAGRAVFVFEM